MWPLHLSIAWTAYAGLNTLVHALTTELHCCSTNCLQATAPSRKKAAASSSTAKEDSESSEEEKPKVCGHYS